MIKISIPLPEKISSNKIYAGQHWSIRKKQADLFHLSLLEFRKIRTRDFPISIDFIFRYKGRLLDIDNNFYMVKLLIDALRSNEIIPNDTPEFINEISITTEKGVKDEVDIFLN